MILDEFVVEINSVFKEKGMKKALASMAKMSIAAFAINKGLESMTSKFADISMAARASGSNMAGMQKWLNAGASSAFTSFDKVKTAIQNLQQQCIQARATGQIPVSIQWIGGNANSSPLQILESFRQKLQGMSEGKAMWLADQAGLKDLLPLLRMTREEFDKLSSAPVLTSKQLNGVFTATSELRKLKTNLVALKDQFFASLAPAFKEFIGVLNKGFALALPYISEGLRKLGNVLTSTINALKEHKLVGAVMLAGLFKMAGGFRILAGVAKMFLGILFTIINHPIIGFLTALALIVEDIYQFFKGNNSVIGKLFDKAAQALNAFAMAFKAKFVAIKEALTSFVKWYVGLWIKIFTPIINFIKKIFDKFGSFISKFRSLIGKNDSAKVEIQGTQQQKDLAMAEGGRQVFNHYLPASVVNHNNATTSNKSSKNMSFGNIIVNVNGGNPAQMKNIGQDIQKQIQTASFGL